MKGMNFLLLASSCLLVTAFAACTSVDEPVSEPFVPIGFSPAMNDANTRYASDDLPATMGVFAYLTEGGGFNASASTHKSHIPADSRHRMHNMFRLWHNIRTLCWSNGRRHRHRHNPV